jgi:hypothetical protein
MSGIWHPDRRQIPVAITACQLLGVAPIRLDAIAQSHQHQPRSNHVTMNAQGDKLPIDDRDVLCLIIGRAMLPTEFLDFPLNSTPELQQDLHHLRGGSLIFRIVYTNGQTSRHIVLRVLSKAS